MFGDVFQDGVGTEPEPETGIVGTVFPATERGTGTVGTVSQEPKPEPSLPVKTVLKQIKSFSERNVGTENRNRSNRPMQEP